MAKLRREGRTQVSAKGEPSDWLCPSHPANQKLELESMLEVARKYPVDGLHFDYIRYPDREHCYCDGCRRRFEAQSGRKVGRNWPKECYSGPRKEEYNDWRCGQITRAGGGGEPRGQKIRPGLKISAAVFGGYPACRDSVAQDWPEWIKAGYLDFVCPMDYTAKDARVRRAGPKPDETGCRARAAVPGHRRHGDADRDEARSGVGADTVLPDRSAAQGFAIFNLDAGDGSVDRARRGTGGTAFKKTSTSSMMLLPISLRQNEHESRRVSCGLFENGTGKDFVPVALAEGYPWGILRSCHVQSRDSSLLTNRR